MSSTQVLFMFNDLLMSLKKCNKNDDKNKDQFLSKKNEYFIVQV